MLQTALALRLRAFSSNDWLERTVLVAVVLAGVVAISPNVADPDLWGHVQYGRDLLQHGLATKTTYSYIAREQPWINHENVMEVVLALGADWLGPLGLVAAKLLAGLALQLVVLHACRKQGAGLLATSLILLLTANGVAHYWSLRPQLFSFAAYAFLLAMLSWCFAEWEGRWWFGTGETGKGKRETDEGFDYVSRFPIPVSPASLLVTRAFHLRISWLWLIPLLMIAWTNAHGGFLAGCAIFGTYLFMRSCEAYAQAGSRAIGTIKRFAVWTGAALFATFLNPYGYNFHLWLLEDLRVPRPEITEWLPPSFAYPQSIPLLLLIALFIATLALSRRSWDATHLVILLATLGQSLAHQRHIPFFALSVAFFLPRHVEDVLARLRDGRWQMADGKCERTRRWQSAALAVGMCSVFGVLGWKLYERASDLKVHRDHYPVSAVQFMSEHALRGRVLCAFNWAQYVLAVPEQGWLVHVDGRCRTAYSQAMLDEHFDFLFGEQPASKRYRHPKSEFNSTKALDHGQPNLVLIDRGQPHSVEVMNSQSTHWILLYRDSLAQLWGRCERYDDPASPDYFPPSNRRISETPQAGHVTWPAFPSLNESRSKS